MNDGLKVKYNVTKLEDGSVVNGCFVLRPDKDPAAVTALYAYSMATENKALARDITKWIRTLETESNSDKFQSSMLIDYKYAENEIHFLREEVKRLTIESAENAAKANVWEETCTLIEALEEFIKAAEIGRMVEAWKEDPNHQVIFKTLLPNGGEILHPLAIALEKFREEQEGGQ